MTPRLSISLAALAALAALAGCGTTLIVGEAPDARLGDAGLGDAGPGDAGLGDAEVVQPTRPTPEVALEAPVPVPDERVTTVDVARLGDTFAFVYFDAYYSDIRAFRTDAAGRPLDDVPVAIGKGYSYMPPPRIVALGERFAIVWLEDGIEPSVTFLGASGPPTPRASLVGTMGNCDISYHARRYPHGWDLDVAVRGEALVVAFVATPDDDAFDDRRVCVKEIDAADDVPAVVREDYAPAQSWGGEVYRAFASIAADAETLTLFFTSGRPGGTALLRWTPFMEAAPEMVGPPRSTFVRLSRIVSGPETTLLAWGEWVRDSNDPGVVRALRLDRATAEPLDETPLELGSTARPFRMYARPSPQPAVTRSDSGFFVAPPPARNYWGLRQANLFWHLGDAGDVSTHDVPAEAHHGLHTLISTGDGYLGALATCPGEGECEATRATATVTRWDGATTWSNSISPMSRLAGTSHEGRHLAWLECSEDRCVAVFARDAGLFASTFDTLYGRLEAPTPIRLAGDGDDPAAPAAGDADPWTDYGRRPCVATDGQRFLVAWPEVSWSWNSQTVEDRIVGRFLTAAGWSAPEVLIRMRANQPPPARAPMPIACAFSEGQLTLAYGDRSGDLRLARETAGGFTETMSAAREIQTGQPFVMAGSETGLVLAFLSDNQVYGEATSVHVAGGEVTARNVHGPTINFATLRAAALPSGGYALTYEGADRVLRVLPLDARGLPRVAQRVDDVAAMHGRGRVASSDAHFLAAFERLGAPAAESVLRWVDAEGQPVGSPLVLGARQQVEGLKVLRDGSVALLHREVTPRTLPSLSELRAQIIAAPALPVE